MKGYDQWFGVPRREIAWYPKIDPAKCVGCGMCVAICGREVYSYDFADRRSVVVKPYNCLVGCTTCSNLCPAGAIEFPSIEIVRDVIKKYGVFKVVKEKLKEKHGDFVERAKKY